MSNPTHVTPDRIRPGDYVHTTRVRMHPSGHVLSIPAGRIASVEPHPQYPRHFAQLTYEGQGPHEGPFDLPTDTNVWVGRPHSSEWINELECSQLVGSPATGQGRARRSTR